MKNVSVYILTTACAVVLAFSIVSCGGGDSHPLKGSWFGFWFPLGEIEVTFDNQGNITEFLHDGDPFSGFVSGQAESRGPGVYLLTVQANDDTIYGYFLMDYVERHALFVLDVVGTPIAAALEKDAESLPVYGVNDIISSWAGYSWAYSDSALAMAVESSMSLLATSHLPDNSYSLTMPEGWILLGYFDEVFIQVGYYGGPGTGEWDVRALMSADKQFIGVVAEGGNFDNSAFFAFNREP